MSCEIIHGDCTDYMKKIPDSSFDAIITDPPWLTTRLSFDRKPLDFGMLFSEFRRLLKDSGWFFLFGTVEMASIALKKGWKRKFEYIWVKPGPVIAHPRVVRPLVRHEIVYAFVKDKVKPGSLYYDRKAISTIGKPYRKSVPASWKSSEYQNSQHVGRGIPREKMKPGVNHGTRYPTTVLEFPNKPQMNKNERTPHPTQKPIALMETIVKGYCPPGGLVLDPFAGSGSTAVACKKHGRKCIAIEKDPSYIKIIELQLEKLNSNII